MSRECEGPGKLIKIDRQGQPLASVSFGAADPSQGNLVALTEVAANLQIIEKDQYVVGRQNWALAPDGRGGRP